MSEFDSKFNLLNRLGTKARQTDINLHRCLLTYPECAVAQTVWRQGRDKVQMALEALVATHEFTESELTQLGTISYGQPNPEFAEKIEVYGPGDGFEGEVFRIMSADEQFAGILGGMMRTKVKGPTGDAIPVRLARQETTNKP